MDEMILALMNLWKITSSGSSMSVLLQGMVSAAEAISGASFGEIILFGDAWNHLEYQFATEEEISLLRKLQNKLNSKIIVVAARNVAELKIAQDPDSEIPHFSEYLNTRIQTRLSAPILLEGKKIGLINLFNKPTEFTAGDRDFIKAFTEHGVSIIEKEMYRNRAAKMEHRINAIFDAIADGLLVLESDGMPLMCNRSFRQMFMSGKSETESGDEISVEKENTSIDPISAILPSFLGHTSDHGIQEIYLLKPQGRAISSQYVYTRDPAKRIQEVIISFRDITRSYREEQKFLQLIAMLSRRISKLTRAYKNRNNEKRKRIRYFKEASRLMHNLIYLTEIKSGPLRVQKMPAECSELIDSIKHIMEKDSIRKKIELSMNFSPGVGEVSFSGDVPVLAAGFKSIWKFHLKYLKRFAKVHLNFTVRDSEIVISYQTSSSDWKTVPSSDILIWQRCIDRYIEEDGKRFILEPAFVKHAMESHKGSFNIATNGNSMIFELKLPAVEV